MPQFQNKPGGGSNGGGGTGDSYSKTEVNTLLSAKANNNDVYKKADADNLLSQKADLDDVYDKEEIDFKLSHLEGVGGGNDGLVGTKEVDETNLSDGKFLVYKSSSDKYELVNVETSGGGTTPGESENVHYSNSGYLSINSVKDALDQLLYVTPVISSFSNNVNTVEKGSTVTSVNLSWSINKNVTTQSIDNGVGSLLDSDRSKSLTGLSLTANVTYTLTVGDGKNNVSKTTSISFVQKRYYGVSNKDSITSADILTLSGEFATSRTQTKSLNPVNQYLYFAWPSTFGAPSFKVNGLANNAWIKTIVSFTNASGFTESYDVYRSQYSQNGTNISIEIS